MLKSWAIADRLHRTLHYLTNGLSSYYTISVSSRYRDVLVKKSQTSMPHPSNLSLDILLRSLLNKLECYRGKKLNSWSSDTFTGNTTSVTDRRQMGSQTELHRMLAHEQISDASGLKCTILWWHVGEILLFNRFFILIVDTCLSCEDIAQQSCAMVPRWRFLRPVFSVLWCCWLGGRKGIWSVKNMGEDGGGTQWLVRMEWRPGGWPVCLPLLIFPCTIKSRSSLLASAHPGGPGKRAVKRLWWRWWYFQRAACSTFQTCILNLH